MAFWKDPATGITHVTRLTDGRVMCCICMEYKERDDLADVEDEPGRKWDMCQECKDAEDARRSLHPPQSS